MAFKNKRMFAFVSWKNFWTYEDAMKSILIVGPSFSKTISPFVCHERIFPEWFVLRVVTRVLLSIMIRMDPVPICAIPWEPPKKFSPASRTSWKIPIESRRFCTPSRVDHPTCPSRTNAIVDPSSWMVLLRSFVGRRYRQEPWPRERRPSFPSKAWSTWPSTHFRTNLYLWNSCFKKSPHTMEKTLCCELIVEIGCRRPWQIHATCWKNKTKKKHKSETGTFRGDTYTRNSSPQASTLIVINHSSLLYRKQRDDKFANIHIHRRMSNGPLCTKNDTCFANHNQSSRRAVTWALCKYINQGHNM